MELVWDLFMDDNSYSTANIADYFDSNFDSIGVACNCHPSFEQFCVIELGSNIIPHSDNKPHIHTVIPDIYRYFFQFPHKHEPVVPQLFLRGDPRCVFNRTDGMCSEVSQDYYDPSKDDGLYPSNQIGADQN